MSGQSTGFNADIHSVFGVLDVNLLANATSSNVGTFDASTSIGIGTINFNVGPNATFVNQGTVITSSGPVPLYGVVNISSDTGGHFDNAGLIDIRGGQLDVTFDHDMSNSGRIVAEGSAAATSILARHSALASVFNNSGMVDADGSASLLFHGLAAFEARYGSVVNSGLIHANGGSITIDGDLDAKPGMVMP